MSEPLLVTMDKACFLLSLARRTLDQMRADGKLDTVKIGGRRLVPMSEIHRIASARPGKDARPTASSVPGLVEGSNSEDGQKTNVIQLLG